MSALHSTVVAKIMNTSIFTAIGASKARRALAVVIILCMLWISSYWMRRETYVGGFPIYSSKTTGIHQYTLPNPHENFRYTLMSAVVLHQNNTYREKYWQESQGNSGYYVSVLGSFENLEATGLQEEWQIKQSDTSFIIQVTCHFDQDESVEGVFPPTGGFAFVVNCPLSPVTMYGLSQKQHGPLIMRLEWELRDGKEKFFFPVTLVPEQPSEPSEVGICLSPIWGHVSARATLEWREHHRRLGVQVVHWYARDASIRHWVSRYNQLTKAKDTFVYAPPISLETYGQRGKYMQAGLYADQVLWYQHCKYDSYVHSPTTWLAYMDRDERFIPKNMSVTTTTDEEVNGPNPTSEMIPALFKTVPDEVGSACFAKGYHAGQPVNLTDYVSFSVAQSEPLEIAYISDIALPSDHNVKCVHRVAGYEIATVHYGETWYPGFSAKFYNSESSLWFLHDTKHGSVGSTAFNCSEETKRFLGDLWTARETLWARMNWHCDELPCRFGGPDVSVL